MVHVQIEVMSSQWYFFMQGRLMFIFSSELMAGLEYFFMQVRLKTNLGFFKQGSLMFKQGLCVCCFTWCNCAGFIAGHRRFIY